MAWTSHQGRSGGLVSLPGTSLARLSSIRERRVNAAKAPWTPTQPSSKPSLQTATSNVLTTSYKMKPTTLLTKLQAAAAPDQPLIRKEVKDNGGTILHFFSAGMFALVVKPAFSSLSKNFFRVVNGHQVSLPHPPDLKRDQQGLLVSMKLEFLVETSGGAQQLRKVLHLYSTHAKIMTQGSSAFSDSPDSPRVAQWFVSLFVLPQIEEQIKKNGTNKSHVTAMNNAILNLKLVPPSQASFLSQLVNASQNMDGVNTAPVQAACGICCKRFDKRTLNIPTCLSCKYFFHGKCLKDHECSNPTTPRAPSLSTLGQDLEESDTEDLPSPAKNTPSPTSFSQFSSPQRTSQHSLAPALDHIDSDIESPSSTLGTPLNYQNPTASIRLFQPAQ